jgi:hypothetical protein
MSKRKLSHVGELILELDAWMQHAISVESWLGKSKLSDLQVKAFEDARNTLADTFPDAIREYKDQS